MLTKRIIACLDVHAERVVKGVQFSDLQDTGDPAELALSHGRAEADEVVLLDISSTYENRSTLLTWSAGRLASYSFLSRWAEAFDPWMMPLPFSMRAPTKLQSIPRPWLILL